ncbi:MAG: polar amino acid transport system substrate-binding protein [Thermosediminibacterales bacterium]|nr:polar amino acid transport system substrate-binding protein [Thermosediminibacterales bacterium]
MRSKKIISLLIVLVFAISFLAGCSGNQEQPKQETEKQEQSTNQKEIDNSLERVQKAGKLVAGLDDAFPPFGFRNDKNELVGFDIELGNEIAKKLGVEMEWVPTQWSGVILSLKSKKFDIIMSGMSITDERKKEVNFTEPYIATGQVLVIKSDNNLIKSKDDLKDKVVGTQLGSTGEEAAKKLEGLKELKTYDGYPEAFNDLDIGRLDAVVVDEITAQHYMAKRPGVFKQVGGLLTNEPMGIAVRKEDKALLDAINKAIKELIEDGTYAKISKKWFGRDKSLDL